MSEDIPQNLAAERAVLGALLLAPDLADRVWSRIRPDAFWHPANTEVAQVLHAKHQARQAADPQILLTELAKRGSLQRLGGGPFVHTLMESCSIPGNAGTYADDVADTYRRRRLLQIGQRLTERSCNPTSDMLDMLKTADDDIQRVRLDVESVSGDDFGDVLTVEELAQSPTDYEWLVPGLLERQDRLILTGPEGGGKSTLIRQVAVCLAAGLDPFTHEYIEPVRVLVVDCENSQRQNTRAYRPMLTQAQAQGRPTSGRLMVSVRASGLDLTRDEDAVWLTRRAVNLSPDVIVIGPLYKLHRTNTNDEEAARAITSTLDLIRVRADCALIIEAHSPQQGSFGHRPVRPRGSSLFLGWPEFGYGLRMADEMGAEVLRLMDVVPWRGARDERTFPRQIQAGARWPWEAR